MSRRVVVAVLTIAGLAISQACASQRGAGVEGRVSVAAAPPVVPRPAPVPVPLTVYQAPVAASVRDGFRPPPTPFGAGNRGVEYATTPGQPVWAAGEGVVVFAGAVAGTIAVSIQHADGLRTTYTHLAATEVSAGARVARGEVIGSASDRLHFGARLGSAYLDPSGLLEPATGPARLVPDSDASRRGLPPSGSKIAPG